VGSLTEEQKSILIGCLLGDGTLRRKRNTLLEINHSSKQEDYVFWLYSKFKGCVLTPPKIRVNGPNRTSYRFTTRSIVAFNVFYEKFYPGNLQKKIPRDLDLNPLSLAVWFMDDGSKSRNALYLNTQQFNLEDQKYLISLLDNSFGIKATLNKDKCYYRIRIRVSSIEKFRDLTSPFIIKSMEYKLPL
jgi:hypothetical protein